MKVQAWVGIEVNLSVLWVKAVGSNARELPPLVLLFNWQDLPSAGVVWPLLDRTDSQDFGEAPASSRKLGCRPWFMGSLMLFTKWVFWSAAAFVVCLCILQRV